MDSVEQSVGNISNVQSWLERNHRCFKPPIGMPSPPIQMSNDDDSNSINNHLDEDRIRNQHSSATDVNATLVANIPGRSDVQVSSGQQNLSCHNESGDSITIEDLVDETQMQNDSQTESNVSTLSESKNRTKDLKSLAFIVATIQLETNIVKIKNVNHSDLIAVRNHLNLCAKMIDGFSQSGVISFNSDDNIIETNATGGVEPCSKKLSTATKKLSVAVTALINTVEINSMSVQEVNGMKRALSCQVLFLQLAVANIDKVVNP